MKKASKKIMIDLIWLNYYNGYLYDKGIITENERNKMKNMITSNYHACVKNKKARALGKQNRL